VAAGLVALVAAGQGLYAGGGRLAETVAAEPVPAELVGADLAA
jgi:hypothetical protein